MSWYKFAAFGVTGDKFLCFQEFLQCLLYWEYFALVMRVFYEVRLGYKFSLASGCYFCFGIYLKAFSYSFATNTCLLSILIQFHFVSPQVFLFFFCVCAAAICCPKYEGYSFFFLLDFDRQVRRVTGGICTLYHYFCKED